MKKLELKTIIYKFNNIEELAADEQTLIQKAREITVNSYSPYSNFKVGVALLLDDGTIVTGTNQENAAYPSGLCAERTAIFYANSQYPNHAIVKMVITARKNNELVSNPITPCGACRQVMLESETRFQQEIKIILDGKDSILMVKDAKTLIPLTFTDKDLL